MNFCPNCGKPLAATAQFCSNCGHAVATSNPVPPVVEPVAPVEPVTPVAPPASIYSVPGEPTYYTAPATVEVSAKDKAMGFVGMGLAIGGLVFAVLGLLYAFIGMAGELDGFGFGAAVGFGIFSLPMSILGRKFANDSLEAGNTSGAAAAGTKLGIAGIIVSAVMFFFGFISLMMAM